MMIRHGAFLISGLLVSLSASAATTRTLNLIYSAPNGQTLSGSLTQAGIEESPIGKMIHLYGKVVATNETIGCTLYAKTGEDAFVIYNSILAALAASGTDSSVECYTDQPIPAPGASNSVVVGGKFYSIHAKF